MIPFQNRLQAGEMLAKRLEAYARRQDAIVIALPRGGVPVAYAIAAHLEIPLDLILVRKLGVPGREELDMGAVSSEGVCVLRSEIIAMMDIPPDVIEATAQRALRELTRCERTYRQGRAAHHLQGQTIIVVDDGLASGATMQAAVRALRHAHPAQILVAIPVAAPESLAELQNEVDQIICLHLPEWFDSVGQWYEDYSQVSDAQVKAYLAQAEQWHIPQEREVHDAVQRRAPRKSGLGPKDGTSHVDS